MHICQCQLANEKYVARRAFSFSNVALLPMIIVGIQAKMSLEIKENNESYLFKTFLFIVLSPLVI